MHKYPYIIVALIGLIILVGGLLFLGREQYLAAKGQASSCSGVSGEMTVIMKDEDYEPLDLQIKKCTKVTFTNAAKEARWPASNIHPTHGIYPEFDPKEPVEQGGEWSFVFDKVGSWRYHDHLVPSIHGKIEVLE